MDHPSIPLPPTIPAKCRAIFQKKVEVLPPEGFGVLGSQVHQYLRTLRQAAQTNKNLDLPLLEKMAAALLILLGDHARLPEEHRALLVGAARYFIETSDATDDLKDPWGFDDDLAVLNTVLLVIGRQDLVVTRDSGPADRPKPRTR